MFNRHNQSILAMSTKANSLSLFVRSSISSLRTTPPNKPHTTPASFFTSLPPPKLQHPQNPGCSTPKSPSSSVIVDSIFGSARLFNSLPHPRSRKSKTLQFQTLSPVRRDLKAVPIYKQLVTNYSTSADLFEDDAMSESSVADLSRFITNVPSSPADHP